MKCIVIDDQEAFHVILSNLIHLDPTLVLVGTYTSAEEAYKVIQKEKIDLLFLDIGMPGMGGLQLAKLLKGMGPMIIFTTSTVEHAVEAFELNVIDYLVKPLQANRFLQAVEKAKSVTERGEVAVSGEKDGFVFIRDSYAIKRIKTDDILYLEANGNYVDIYMNANQMYSIHAKIAALEQKLPASMFLKIHRSYIVNLSKVDVIEGKTMIVDGKIIPIADAYRPVLSKRMLIL